MWKTTLTPIVLAFGLWLIVPNAHAQEQALHDLSDRLVDAADWMESFPASAHAKAESWRDDAAELRDIAAKLDTLAGELGGDGTALEDLAASSDAEWILSIAQNVGRLEGLIGRSSGLLRSTANRADDLAHLADQISTITSRLGFLVTATRSAASFTAGVSAWIGRTKERLAPLNDWAHDRWDDAVAIFETHIEPSLGFLEDRFGFSLCLR